MGIGKFLVGSKVLVGPCHSTSDQDDLFSVASSTKWWWSFTVVVSVGSAAGQACLLESIEMYHDSICLFVSKLAFLAGLRAPSKPYATPSYSWTHFRRPFCFPNVSYAI